MVNLLKIGEDARLKMAENANQSINKNNLNNLSPLQRLKKVFEREAEEQINKQLKSMTEQEKIAFALTHKWPVVFWVNTILEQTPQMLCELLPEVYSLDSEGEAHYYLSKTPGGVHSFEGGLYTFHTSDPMSWKKFYLFDALKVHKCNGNYKDTIKYLYEHRTQLNIPEELFTVTKTQSVNNAPSFVANTTAGGEVIPSTDFNGLVLYNCKDLINYIDLTKPQETLFKGFFPKGELSSIYGASGSGKSSFLTTLLLHSMAGLPFAGVPTNMSQNTRLVWISNEESKESVFKRFNYNLQSDIYDNCRDDIWSRLYILTNEGATTDTYIANLKKVIKTMRGKYPSDSISVILDPFNRIMHKDMDYNKNGLVSEIYVHLKQILITCKVDYFILIDHTNKGKNNTQRNGAGSKEASERCSVLFTRNKSTNVVTCKCETQNYFDLLPEGENEETLTFLRTSDKSDYQLIDNNNKTNKVNDKYQKLNEIIDKDFITLRDEFAKATDEKYDGTMLDWILVKADFNFETIEDDKKRKNARDSVVKKIRGIFEKKGQLAQYEMLKFDRKTIIEQKKLAENGQENI